MAEKRSTGKKNAPVKKNLNQSVNDPTTGHERRSVAIKFTEPSRTQQNFKDQCDVNRIVARYQETGIITHLNNRQPQYGYADAQTFHEAMNTVTNAQMAFEALPAALRKRFGHDPVEFLEFMSDPENASEAAKLGLYIPTGEDENPVEPGISPSSDRSERPPEADQGATESSAGGGDKP